MKSTRPAMPSPSVGQSTPSSAAETGASSTGGRGVVFAASLGFRRKEFFDLGETRGQLEQAPSVKF